MVQRPRRDFSSLAGGPHFVDIGARRNFTRGAQKGIKPGDNLYRHLRDLVDRPVTLRLGDGSDLAGKPKFVAKDCLLFEESPGKPLVTVALAHIVLVRLSE